MKAYIKETDYPCHLEIDATNCIGISNCDNELCELVRDAKKSTDLHTKLPTNHVDTEK